MNMEVTDDKEYLRTFRAIFHSSEEAEQYLYDSWERIRFVLQWLQEIDLDRVNKVLELGSNPYYLTLLIRKHFDFDLHLANYFGDPNQDGVHDHIAEGADEVQEFRYSHFNLETTKFPYEDGFFDCVIFCEILEHLLLDADFAVREIHRVLRKDGYAIVTTPNATRLANFVRLFKGKNIYDRYSPYGIYGRHNREYSYPEVIELLKRNGFSIVKSEVRNIYPHPLKSRILQALRPSVWYEHIFVLAKKT